MADHFNGIDLNALNAMIQNVDFSSLQNVLNTVDLNQAAALMQRLFPSIPVEYTIADAAPVAAQNVKNSGPQFQMNNPNVQFPYAYRPPVPPNKNTMMDELVRYFTLFLVISRFFPRRL